MTTIVHNLELVHARVTSACVAVGRDPAGVRLLAVSKTFAAEAVMAATAGGQRAFGENYIVEAVQKILALRAWTIGRGAAAAGKENPLEWHCIGPVQSNKTRLVAEHFGMMPPTTPALV